MSHTPFEAIQKILGSVPAICDRITGDRADYPLFVAACAQNALAAFKIQSRIFYGRAAWVAVMPEATPTWAGFWEERPHFWLESEFKETIDLNAVVAHRRLFHLSVNYRGILPPPLLWSAQLPDFFRYAPDGLAEFDIELPEAKAWWERAEKEIREVPTLDVGFPNVPVIGPDRRLLDDSKQSFLAYDRVLKVKGIPECPF